MSAKYLGNMNNPNENINIRVNDLVVDGTFGLDGTHVTTWGTIYATPIQGNLQYSKVGNYVTLFFPPITGNLVSSNTILTSVTPLPTNLRPSVPRYALVQTFANQASGVFPEVGLAVINTSGIIQMYYLPGNNVTSEFPGANVNYAGRLAGIEGTPIFYML